MTSGRPLRRRLGGYLLVSLIGFGGACNGAAAPQTSPQQQNFTAQKQLQPAAKTALTAHPGHYVALNKFDPLSVVAELKRPGIVGFQRRHTWQSLEPRRDTYDLSAIARDLDMAAANGLQYVAMIEDKTFNGDVPTPAYLQDDGLTLKNRNGGYVTARWRPEVVERYNALIREIGSAFDGNPNFEGIALQETALSLEPAVLAAQGYSAGAYEAALTSMLQHAASALPHSRVFWYMNFLPNDQRAINRIIENTVIGTPNIVVGGPDVLPDRRSLQRHAYPLYQRYRDRVNFFNSMQFDSYAHTRAGQRQVTQNRRPQQANRPAETSAMATPDAPKYWSLSELTQFAVNELHVSYLFWNRKNWRKPIDSYSFDDALPVLAAYPDLVPLKAPKIQPSGPAPRGIGHPAASSR